MTSRTRSLLIILALVSFGAAGCSSPAPHGVQEQPPEPGAPHVATARAGRIPSGTITLKTNRQVTFEPNSLRYCTTNGAGFKLSTGETVWLSGIASLEFGPQEGAELQVTYRPWGAKGSIAQIFPGPDSSNSQPATGRMSAVCQFFKANGGERYLPGELTSIIFNQETEPQN
ncbi:hypothetical protein ACQP1G_23565 [Nocardia sp. CA-107356]|uniref:hypothetical protein n=1 Tax=Nocardia sp. CA-107356 TaxID=3239972 RepID=UPI003D8E8039